LRTMILYLRPFQSDESTYVYAAYTITRDLVPYREVLGTSAVDVLSMPHLYSS